MNIVIVLDSGTQNVAPGLKLGPKTTKGRSRLLHPPVVCESCVGIPGWCFFSYFMMTSFFDVENPGADIL